MKHIERTELGVWLLVADAQGQAGQQSNPVMVAAVITARFTFRTVNRLLRRGWMVSNCENSSVYLVHAFRKHGRIRLYAYSGMVMQPRDF